MLDFFSMLTGGGMPRYPWEMDPTADAAPWRAPEAIHQYFRPDSLAPHPPGYGPLGPLPGRQSGGGIPYMTAADAGGGGDDAPGQPPVLRGTGSGPDGMLTAEEYARQRAQQMKLAEAPAAPVPRSLSPELYRPLTLTSTMPPAGPAAAPAAAPPGVTVFQGRLYNGSVRPEHDMGPAPPGTPDTPPIAQPGMPGVAPPGRPGAAPAVPGVLQPRPASPLGGLFGGMLGGGGMTGPDGKELTTEQMMDRYLRMQMQRAMMPDFGKMAAAFAEAGKPSLLPTGGMGAALGKAAGAMSAGGGDAKDAFSMMKIAQEIQDMRDKGAGRKAIGGKIDQFIELYTKMKGGGGGSAAPAAPSGGGQPPVKIQPLSGEAVPADRDSYGDYGGGGDAVSAPDTSPHPVDIIPKYESGGRNIEQQVVGPQGGYNPSVGRVTGPSSASGYWQMLDSTYRNAAAKTAPVQIGDQVVDPSSFSRAMHAPYEVQREVAKTLYNQRGYADWAPYNKNLRAAISRGEGPPSGGPQLASTEGRVRIQPLSGAAVPAGAPAGGEDEDALALLLAQIGSQASTYGLGDTVKPLETWFYNRPEYAGRKAGAEQAGKEAAGAPYRERETRLKDELDTARERALKERQAELDRETKEAEQRRHADLTIAPVDQWPRDPQTGQPVPITVGEMERRIRGAPSQAAPVPMAPPMAPGPGPGVAAPAAPGGGGMGVGGALPLARPMAPAAAAGGPAGPPAPAAPAGGLPAGYQVPPPPKEVPKDYQLKYVPEQNRWDLEVIPGSATHQAQQKQDAATLATADTVLGSIDRSLKMSNDWTTGAYGNILRQFPGTGAYNLSAELENLGSAVQIEEIMKMRQSSPTGAAMGNLTEGEGKVLRSAKASLDQAQTKPEFDAALKRLRATYIDTVYGSREKVAALVKEGKVSQRVADSVEAMRAQAEAENRPGGTPSQTSGAKPPPMVGEVRSGYRYNGGNPADPNSYTKVQ